MSFIVQIMLGSQALVSGKDLLGNEGKTTVSTTQWDELNARTNFSSATEDFDAAVEAFFAPLVEASEKVDKALSPKERDPAEYVVLKKGIEAVAGEHDQIVELTRDSIILRLIEKGTTDRLVWVDESTLGILAA